MSLFQGLLTARGWRGLWDAGSLIRISCKNAHWGCIKETLCCGQGVHISRLFLSLAECPRIRGAPPYKWGKPSFLAGVGETADSPTAVAMPLCLLSRELRGWVGVSTFSSCCLGGPRAREGDVTFRRKAARIPTGMWQPLAHAGGRFSPREEVTWRDLVPCSPHPPAPRLPRVRASPPGT